MLACHAGGPGSIPGRCKFVLFSNEIISFFPQIPLNSSHKYTWCDHDDIWKEIKTFSFANGLVEI